ncbi:hypothetical protein KYJ26_13955 [Bacillus sp. MCCB 382]|uniref:hypothetical protein n=1 Tax=Bacillus sp. MCCB 382 TaxID=2860197 RepID=UPI001C55CE9E|nr:hypothetical protein [Bacillus sp. MCCB 382]
MYVTEQNPYDVVSGQNVEQAVAELKKEGKAIEVKESGQIESIMNQLEYDPNDYTLILKFQNEGRIDTYGLSKENAPSFIKEKFEE